MKSMKVLVAALALCVMTSIPALQAQEKKGRGGMTPEQQIERIETAVGSLTADQKTKITAILAKSREEMQGVPKEERKEKGAAMQKKSRADIRAVLTPDQQKKYDAMAQGGEGKGGGRKKNQ
jgi:Spy/CpxP family protein refolding chaperone